MQKYSKMRVAGGGFIITTTIESRLPSKVRRAVALAILRRIKDIVTVLESCNIYHSDRGPFALIRDFDREVDTYQAAKSTDTRGKLGFEIRMARLKSGLTQEQLGNFCELSSTQISRIEKGHAFPRPSTFSRIVAAIRKTQTKRKFDKGAPTRIAPLKRKAKEADMKPGPSDLENLHFQAFVFGAVRECRSEIVASFEPLNETN